MATITLTPEDCWLEGKQEGKQEGIQEGKQEGILEGMYRVAKRMKETGEKMNLICKYTGLSTNEVNKL
ncbi:MAG: hypothetical protein B0D92_02070 [Spirochaeta sp. LUC14_002_19_P3]|nr:MAG: hypothetical protein B0D92_02070 [Spirochaeta sp. LUC14_002_19_P3]